MTRGQSDSQDLVQYRAVYGSLVDSLEFKQLSPDARATFLILRVSPECGPAGIFLFYLEPLMDRTGLPRERVQNSLDELEQAGWIHREQNLLWIRNALRFTPNFNVTNENHRISILKQVRTLPKLAIVRKFCAYYKLDTIPHAIPHAMPDQEEVLVLEKEEEEEKEYEEGERDPKREREGVKVKSKRGDVSPLSSPLSVSFSSQTEKPKTKSTTKEKDQSQENLLAFFRSLKPDTDTKSLDWYREHFTKRGYDPDAVTNAYHQVFSRRTEKQHTHAEPPLLKARRRLQRKGEQMRRD